MQDMTPEEFNRLKEESARHLKEIYKGRNMPPYPDFVTLNHKEEEKVTENYKKEAPKTLAPRHKNNPNFDVGNMFKFINFPELLKNSDSLLILGLIFLLISDKADEKLVLALLFIML